MNFDGAASVLRPSRHDGLQSAVQRLHRRRVGILVFLLALATPGAFPAILSATTLPSKIPALHARVDQAARILRKIEGSTKRLSGGERNSLLQLLYAASPAQLAAAESATDVRSLYGAVRAGGTPPAADPGASWARPSAIGDYSSEFVFVPITPCRLLDTRLGPGGTRIPANTYYGVDVDAPNVGTAPGCNAVALGLFNHVADLDRVAYVVSATVVAPSAPGFLSVLPVGASPTTSTVNFQANQTIASQAIVQDNGSGSKDFNLFANVSTHVIVDLIGIFGPPKQTLSCMTVASSDSQQRSCFDALGRSSTCNVSFCPNSFTLTGGTGYCGDGAAVRSLTPDSGLHIFSIVCPPSSLAPKVTAICCSDGTPYVPPVPPPP